MSLPRPSLLGLVSLSFLTKASSSELTSGDQSTLKLCQETAGQGTGAAKPRPQAGPEHQTEEQQMEAGRGRRPLPGAARAS